MLGSFKSHFLLTEDRIDWLKANTKSIDSSHDVLATKREPHEIIDHLAAADPHPKKAYTQWALNRYRSGDFRQEDSPRLSAALSGFHRYKDRLEKKDINQYGSLSDLEDAVEPHSGTAASHREEKQAIKEEGSERVHDENGVKVTKLLTHGAACQYGAGTKWCTASKDSPSMFDHYSKQGPLYAINTPDDRKYQFHFPSQQFMNEKDQPEKLEHLTSKYPELKNVEAFKGEHPAFDTREGIIHRATSGEKYGNGVSPIAYDAEAKKPVLSGEHLRVAAQNPQTSLYDVARHPHTPSDVLRDVSKIKHDAGPFTGSPKYSSELSRNPNIDSETFRNLASSAKSRKYAADSSALALSGRRSEDLEHLASLHPEHEHSVHESIAQNPHASPEHLDRYVRSDNYLASSHALRNPSVSEDSIRWAHENGKHLGAVAASPRAPRDVLQDLASREGDGPAVSIVRNLARKNLDSRKGKK